MPVSRRIDSAWNFLNVRKPYGMFFVASFFSCRGRQAKQMIQMKEYLQEDNNSN